jgi:hypothetical protein
LAAPPKNRPNDRSWKHPGEFGRASAWPKRSRRDLEMQPNADGHPPSAIFQQRADMYITIPAIPTPAGMTAPDASTGEAYIRRTDGTPRPKRKRTQHQLYFTLVR